MGLIPQHPDSKEEMQPAGMTFIPMTPPGPLKPTAPTERIQVLDTLRGFAVLGILTVNILAFSAPIMTGSGQPPVALADRIVLALIRFFAEMKFYSLFSFLFGLGFALQMERGAARWVDAMPVFRRRLYVLLGIGLVHAFFIWSGDILVAYAVMGFALTRFRNTPPRRLLWWAAIGIAIPTLLFGMVALSGGTGSGTDGYREAMDAYAYGSYRDITLQRMVETGMVWLGGLLYGPHAFAMFLLGLWAGRQGIIFDIPASTPLLRRVMAWGFLLGVVPNLVYAAGLWRGDAVGGYLWDDIGNTVSFVGATAFSLVYAAGLTLLASRPGGCRVLSPLAPVGRMALSNYLFQSVVCTMLFYNYGLGLFGLVGPAQALAIAFAVFALQVPLSAWWLSKFTFGPPEWLWRSLTYGARQPMRRPA